MGAYSYQNLEVWNRSVDLVVDVYQIVSKLPKHETYALGDQLRRAAVSVPSNIAEGQKRFSVKDTTHFCTIALGSLAELETQLIIVNRVYTIETSKVLESCEIITRMLHALIKSLRGSSV
ncbi:four helix bundle protein [Candidatus Saccharibacteria bacterium]|nr:four helix bundle protein [Candidatus Saccharibacteria bacterium]